MNERNDRRYRVPEKKVNCFVCFPNDNAAVTGASDAVAADAKEERTDTRRRRACEFSEPVCINTSQIYDSCRDRDCVADQRVYLTQADQDLINCAINVKLKKAEIIWVYTDVEPLSFNRG